MKSERRVVIVTGGSIGIGKEIARGFADNGDYVVICARHMGALQNTAREIASFEGQVIPLACDISNKAAVKSFVDSVLTQFNRIDVLVNNAGIYGPIGLSYENDADEWLEALEINLFGVFLVTQHVLPIMIEQRWGSIINLSGGGATSSKPRYSAYAASKAGLVRFTEVLADEVMEQNITVNAIAPGFIATRLHEHTIDAGEKAGADLAKVEEKLKTGGDDPTVTMELALFLASDEARNITGRLISAVWDDWHKLKGSASVSLSNLYMLRRIDNVFYQEVPKE